MDAWGSQRSGTDAPSAAATANDDDEQTWEVEDKGKDALVVLVDARAQMFAPYGATTNDASHSTSSPSPPTWFHAVLSLLVKLLKAKVVAGDNSLLSVVFFGSSKRPADASSLDHVYELQPLGYASAQRIKQLQSLVALSPSELQTTVGAMDNSETLAFSNALWHCGIAFSGANLKKKDSQRVWIFTNDDACVVPDADEVGRVQKQIQNHAELQRTLNLFYMTPPGKDAFDLGRFYACAFKDFAQDDDDLDDSAADALLQPAFPVASLDDLMETSLRKRFRKRRLSTFPLHVTKEVSIGVELYALAVVQRKSTPINLDASTNAPLKSETKWLCDDTGMYLTPDQIKKYIPYGGKRVYFTRDDMVQMKYYDAPGLQLLCFKPLSTLQWNENIRSPYFVYPCDGFIEGSATAFLALLNAMVQRDKYALARLIARKSSEPRLVALVPQEEVHDELGQVQPTGFNVIFLPYVDDIRDLEVENEEKATEDQIEAAKKLISKLKLSELPSFENPELQKHYASVQALALEDDELEYDESMDTTLPDKDGFARPEVQEAIAEFNNACGDIDRSNLKRKEKAPAVKRTPKKKAAKVGDDGTHGADAFDKATWIALVVNNGIHKKTVAELKDFLTAHSLPIGGRKADLVARAVEFLDEA